jgi:hypothetical protein
MQLIPNDARFPDLHEEIVLIFRDLQIETVRCELCGDYHPPELHLRPITPIDPTDPEEA